MTVDTSVDDPIVLETVRALEAASAPLRPQEWYALADSHLRTMVEHRLRAIGRELVDVSEHDGKPGGYLSGWSDEVAPTVAAHRGELQTKDLAVLSMIYLHSHILGTLLGEQTIPLSAQLDAHEGPDGRDIVTAAELGDCLRTLQSHELIDHAKRPGLALRRLSVSQRRRLDENLVLLCRPNSLWARQIRQDRAQQPQSEADD
ncbi:hypothetical protein GA0070604_1023 [Micromonospora eburnea]|uniref:Uncharacterized protein n=1 Tax=Micromonospora eburnea TaxID=227316 RepID=A0A1C6TVE1_9ACTN|nr:hypothetical protein GA0070604_1023 [Micromonospora eburnea]